MATIVAAAGGGNWTAGGTWVGGVAPTAADDAQLTSSSGNVTIDTGAICRSLDCTTYTGTLTHTAGVTLTIGDNTAGTSNIALRLASTMTYTLGSSTTSDILFISTSTTAQSVTFAGKVTGNLTFNGAGGSWQFQDGLTATAISIVLVTGTLDTNSQTLSVSIFSANGTLTRTLKLGNSTITCGFGSGGSFIGGSSGAITITPNTATAILTGTNPTFSSATLNWNGLSVVFSGAGTAIFSTFSPTLANVTRVGTAVKTDGLRFPSGSTVTITGTLTVTGNSATNRVLMQSATTGTSGGVNAAAVSLTNVDFTDIAAAGAAIPWTGTSLGNALGNTNITFDTPTTQTWLGNTTGNWSTAANWTSRVPLPQDNVAVNALTSGTITVDMPRLGANIIFTGSSGGTANCSINPVSSFGNIVFVSGMTYSGATTWQWQGRGTHTITSAGKSFPSSVTIFPVTGSYTLLDDLRVPNSINLQFGTFDANNFNVITTNTGSFTTNTANPRVLNMGSGTWTIAGASATPWTVAGAGITLNAGTSTIVFSSATATNRTFAGGGATYNNLTYTVAGSTGALVLTGANTFAAINFSDATNARTLTLPAATTTTITSAFNVNGTSGKLMTVNSSTSGTAAILSKPFGIVSCDYLSVQDSTATGGAAWYTGANSTNVSGNTGWTFSTPATLVAAAGGGNWSAGSTWVGGIVPTAADNVQFVSTSGNVTIDSAAVCRSLQVTGYTGTLTHTAGITLTIGDGTAGLGNTALALSSGMTYTLGNVATSAITFASTSTTQQAIGTANKSLGNWTINGTGSSYTLTDSNTVGSTATATLLTGTFNTNNQACNWGSFVFGGNLVRTLTLGLSAITISGTANNGFWCSGTTNLTITANTAIVTLTSSNAGVVNLGGANMNGTSTVFTTANSQLLNGATLKNVTLTGTAAKTGQLLLSGNITVTGTFTITGNSAINRILVLSNTAGTARSISAAVVSVTNADFMDIVGSGAGSWNLAGISGGAGDCGGNTGITFTAPATQTHTASAGGNWSDVTKWTSRVPLPQDNVVIDANTTGTITADMPRLGADITFAGFTGTAAFSSTANSAYGSWTNGSGMTISGTQTLTLGARANKTLTSNGCTFTQALTFTAPGATYTLSDALNTNGQLGVINGTSGNSVNLNNMAVTCKNLNINGLGANITCGSSIVTLTTTTLNDYVVLRTNNATFSGDTATFIIANATSNSRNFNTVSGMTTATLTYTVAGSPGPLVFPAVNTIGTLNFSDANNARTLTLTPGQTTTITNFNVNGTAGKLMTINSSTPGSAATLSKPTGIVSCDYLSIQDSTATGGASWYAGANSTNVSNNSGWIFSVPPSTQSNFFALFD